MKTFCWLCISFWLLVSCATNYRQIRPASTYYGNTETVNDVAFSYKQGVLTETHNKKYAKHESKTAMKVVAVKIANNGDKPLVIGENAKFFSGNSELRLIDPVSAHHHLKQGVPIYLLYMLFSLSSYNSSSIQQGPNGIYEKNNSVPIGLVLGPGLTLINVGIAATANQNFLKELTDYNMINKTIAPGQTSFGLITIADVGYNPVRLVTQ